MLNVLSVSRSNNTRFGASSASQTYAAKVRWVVGALVGLVTLLSTALVLLYNTAFNQPAPLPPVDAPLATAAPARPRIVVAQKRIEAGAELDPSFFALEEVSSNFIPEDAVLEAELPSLYGKFAREMINTGYPVNRALLSAAPIAEDFPIPAGFRAISISIDEEKSVSYQIRPNHRVDVLLSFTHKGKPAVVTVVETAKVLSVGSNPDPKVRSVGASTATLLVSTDDAMKIELAKQYGRLGLLRASDVEVPKAVTDSTPTVLENIFNTPEQTAAPEENTDGQMIMTDPRTGRQLVYKLRNGQWKLEKLNG